jgi:predicted DNA repair protein MutK
VSTPSSPQQNEERPSILALFFGIIVALALFVATFIPFLLAPIALLAFAYLAYYMGQRKEEHKRQPQSNNKGEPDTVQPTDVPISTPVVVAPPVVVVEKSVVEKPVVAPIVQSNEYHFGTPPFSRDTK